MKYENFTKHRILAFGDSNTYGYNPDTNGRYGDDERWPRVLEKLLGEKFTVIEEGLPGRTSVFEDPITEGLCGLSSITPCMMSHAPLDTIIISLGTNDTKERFGCSAQLIAQGIGRLVQKALHTDAWRSRPDVLVVCPVPISPDYMNGVFYTVMGDGCDKKAASLAKALETQVVACGARFVDAGCFAEVCLHPLDGIHLTCESHKALAKILAQQL